LWRDWFADADERQACTGSLGNLVLVPRALNERARNQDYYRKHALFFADNAPRLPHLTEELRSVPTWSAGHIRAREERLLATIDAMWQLSGDAGAPGGPGGAPDATGSRRQKRAEAAE
jgi:hypothetical protein